MPFTSSHDGCKAFEDKHVLRAFVAANVVQLELKVDFLFGSCQSAFKVNAGALGKDPVFRLNRIQQEPNKRINKQHLFSAASGLP